MRDVRKRLLFVLVISHLDSTRFSAEMTVKLVTRRGKKMNMHACA